MREFKTSSTLSTTAATLSTTAATSTATTTRSEKIFGVKYSLEFFSERVFQNLNMCSFFEAATNFF